MPAVPRTIMPAGASRPEGMLASSVITQRGAVQARDVEAMGVGWREDWRNLRAGNADVEALLAFIRRHARRGTFLWADHPDAPGMGRAPGGLGEENLIRDAAMDTDTDGDGVVDGFEVGVNNVGGTFSLDQSAQKIDLGGGASGAGRVSVWQRVLRVFPGDEVTVSIAYKTANVSGGIPRFIVRYEDDEGTQITTGDIFATLAEEAAFTRVDFTVTVPDGAVLVRPEAAVSSSGAGDTAEVWFKNARLLRASSDPATWANPHVDGGSQTGTSLATAGWPASQTNVVRAGDILRIGGSGETQAAAETDEIVRCFEVAADADSDTGGLATIEIDPPLLSGNPPADGAALRLTGNRARVIIPSYTMPDASPGDILARVQARYREAV